MTRSSTAIAWLLCLALTGSGVARAAGSGAGADEPVPAKLALLVMLKVLTYDRNLAARGEGDFVVYVAVEPGQESARKELERAVEELRGAALRARPVRFVYGPVGTAEELGKQLVAHQAQAVLALAGLSDAGLAALAQAAGELKLYTLSLDPSLVERSVAVGVTNDGGRPKILLNLSASRRMNATFEPAVLKLARIIP